MGSHSRRPARLFILVAGILSTRVEAHPGECASHVASLDGQLLASTASSRWIDPTSRWWHSFMLDGDIRPLSLLQGMSGRAASSGGSSAASATLDSANSTSASESTSNHSTDRVLAMTNQTSQWVAPRRREKLAEASRRQGSRARARAVLASMKAAKAKRTRRLGAAVSPSFGELARVVAAMAAEATASVGDVADGRPLGRSAEKEELYEEEVGGPVNIFDAIAKASHRTEQDLEEEKSQTRTGSAAARADKASSLPSPSPGALVQDNGPDELDTILTPTALGAAVGVVVGTTVGSG